MELLRISVNDRIVLHVDYKLCFRNGDNTYLAMKQCMVYLDQVSHRSQTDKSVIQYLRCALNRANEREAELA